MPAVTPSFVFDLESRMRMIVEDEYLRMTQDDVLWWDEVTRIIPSASRKEIVTWILNTAYLEDMGPGGNIDFEDLTILEHDFESRHAGKGLKIRKDQFEDLDGNGVFLATEWSRQMGAQHGYWPQRQIAQILKDGETGLAYDDKAFFAVDHDLNPFDPAAGTFSNLLVGDQYRIDSAVSVEQAHINLARVYAHIASIKMPNGRDPRFLRPGLILCPPTLFPRAVQLTDAKFIAQAGTAGGGAADVEGIIRRLGYGTPRQADELTGFENETTYFVFARQIAGSEMGAFGYVDRQPFTIQFYSGEGGSGASGIDAILNRADVLEWHTKGRNVAAYGHPWCCFKVKVS